MDDEKRVATSDQTGEPYARIDVNLGWNMIGVTEKISVDDLSNSSLDLIAYEGEYVWYWNTLEGQWEHPDDLIPGFGYYLQVAQPGTFNLQMDSDSVGITFRRGWNLVSVTEEVARSDLVDAGVRLSPVNGSAIWYYDPDQGWSNPSVLEPGKGYFVHVAVGSDYAYNSLDHPYVITGTPIAASKQNAVFRIDVKLQNLGVIAAEEDSLPFEIRTHPTVTIEHLAPIARKDVFDSIGGDLVFELLEFGSSNLLGTFSIPFDLIYSGMDKFVDLRRDHEPRDDVENLVKIRPSIVPFNDRTASFLIWLSSTRSREFWGTMGKSDWIGPFVDSDRGLQMSYSYMREASAGPTAGSGPTNLTIGETMGFRASQY